MFSRIAQTLWGNISREEAAKFGLLASAFFFIIGSYWMLREMKATLFMGICGPGWLATAKIVSLLSVIVMLLFYNKLIDLLEKTNLVYLVTMFFGITFLGMAIALTHPTIGIANTAANPYRLLGWFIYITIEGFGSIMTTLFWAYVASISNVPSAKRGYPIILIGAQLGAIIGSTLNITLSAKIGIPILFALAASGILVIPLIMKVVAHRYEPKSTHDLEKEPSTGIIEGLRLICKHPYLMGILVVSTAAETISAIFDLQMNQRAYEHFGSMAKVNAFLGLHGLLTNSLSLLLIFFGTSYFIRRFGLTTGLVTFPIIIGIMICTTWIWPMLWTFLIAEVILKGFSYALNNPCKEIMYIPTSKDVQFKAKSWIDCQGNRTAKGCGASIGMVFPTHTQLLMYGSIVALGIVAMWIPIALFVGKTNDKLIEENKIIR